ncbi:MULTISPECIES: DUF5615 family PIN-like protein [Microcystis]|jgi:accessory colonization factor AcfC|uniref:DUF5615 family PIN-like protein n=1 Tax=Microcystis TaxID=1125 RepID=UPI001F553EF1|nr:MULTISPECIES: DUF5615 family PIN-like protein [Microcystis]
MSQIRLYLDEDAGQRSVVEALRNLKIDVITTWEAKNIRLPDPDQLVWATRQGRVIYRKFGLKSRPFRTALC